MGRKLLALAVCIFACLLSFGQVEPTAQDAGAVIKWFTPAWTALTATWKPTGTRNTSS